MPIHLDSRDRWRQARVMQDRRPARPTVRRTRGGATRRASTSPVPRTLFHAPSFSAGLVMGAIVVLGAAYLPELLGRGEGAESPVTTASVPSEGRPKLTFEFDELLRNSQIVVDPQPYLSEPATAPQAPSRPGAETAARTAGPAAATPTPGAAGVGYLLQAASFRSREDAERLRAALLLMDFPASTQPISLPDGVWYRVTVGPFDNEVLAQRAMTRLRENDITPIWARR
jgi:cell division protein FtsN